MHRLRGPGGFTLLELLIVLVIGGVLGTVTIRSFSQVHGSLGARTAQSTFLTMHAQARAIAVEQGRDILLVVDPASGEVRIERESDNGIIRIRNLADDYDVAVTVSGGLLALCMTARGFADPRCGNVADRREVTFTRGGTSRTVAILPLGQALEAD
jgi:prepilin-type N-terminal cleavage/methylation domain-containing protein